MASNLLSYAGWTFLPNLVTGWIQSLYYGIMIRAGDRKPQPGTPTYVKHRRRIHVTVVLLYLFYTLYEADQWIQQRSDFYHDLGLAPGVEEKQIKSRFRRLAAIHHPDKAINAEAAMISESNFVHLKTAQDTLLDPVKRFAYERFGPDVLHWQHCASVRDYLLVGLQSTAPVYIGSTIFLVILSTLGYLQWGRFWRYFNLVSLLLLEYHTLTRPYFPPLLTKIINPLLLIFTAHPPLLPFQFLILARKLSITLFIAASQLTSFFQPASSSSLNNKQSQHELQQLARLEHAVFASEAEATRLLALDMAPFVVGENDEEEEEGDENNRKTTKNPLEILRTRVREWLVNNTIRSDPEVRDAVGRALKTKRRPGASGGSGGTRR